MKLYSTGSQAKSSATAHNEGRLVGTRVPDILSTDSTGRCVPLATLWRKGPVLLFFMRHAGCAVCRAHLWHIRDAYPEIVAHGGQVAAVGLTEAVVTLDFMARHHIPFPVLSDPDRTLYRAFGLFEGTLNEISGPTVAALQLKQALQGNLPYMWPGAPIYQLGGSFIVDTSGVIQLSHVARPIFENPSIAEYLAVFDALAGAQSPVGEEREAGRECNNPRNA